MKLFGVFGGLAFVCSIFGVWAASQSIRWLAPESEVLSPGTPYPLRAEASSGLPVHFRVVSGPAVLTGGDLTVTGVDHVLVAAEQAGDSTFGPATTLRSFNRYQIQLEPEPGTDFDAEAQQAVVLDDVMLIAAGAGDFRIYDNPTAGVPRLLGRFDGRGEAQSVSATPAHAFVSFSGGYIQVLDIRDRAYPRQIGRQIPVSGINRSLSLRNSHLYFTEDYEGVGIVDVSQPDQAILVGRYLPPGDRTPIHQVTVQGNRLFVAVPSGLLVVNVFTPAAPVAMGRHVASGIQRMVAISESRVLIFRDAVVQLLDVSDPSSIRELWSYTSSIGRVSDALVDGSVIHLTSVQGGVEVLDLFPSGLPRSVGRMDNLADSSARSFGPIWKRQGGRLYANGRSGGVHAIQMRRRIAQELEWSQPEAGRLNLNVAYPLQAHSSSGLPVEFRVMSGPAVVEGSALRLTNAGPAVVVARQVGTDDIVPVEVRRIFNPTLLQPSLVGTFGFPSWPRDLRVWDGVAFVALGGQGVQLVDVRNPEAPVLLSHITNGAPGFYAVSLARSGSRLYVGGPGFHVYDVANLEAPRLLDTHPAVNELQIIAASGNALVAAGGAGVQVFDLAAVGDPGSVVPIVPNGSYSRSVDCRGSVAAVVESSRDVSLWNVAVPSKPTRLGGIRLESTRGVIAARFRGDELLINTFEGLQSYDVSNPVLPRWIGSYNTPQWQFSRVGASDSFAIVHYQWLDIRDPAAPRRIAELPDVRFAEFSGNHLVTISGEFRLQLFTWRERMLQTVDWIGPGDTILRSGTAYPLAARASSGGPIRFEVLAGPAEIRDGSVVVTNEGPAQSVVVRAVQPGGTADFPGESVRVFNRVEVEFEELGSLVPSASVNGIAITNSYAFVVESTEGLSIDGSTNGLAIVDVQDPARPVPVARVPVGPTPQDVAVSDGLAVVVGWSGFLTVVDVRRPTDPQIVGTLNVAAPIFRVLLRGTTAFLSSPEGIRIVDFSQPSNPRLLGRLDSFDLGLAPRGMTERGGFLYLCNDGLGFTVVDVRNGQRPVRVGGVAEGSGAGGIAFVGDWLWAQASPRGLYALDVSLPSASRIHSLQPIPETGSFSGYRYGSMAVSGNLVVYAASEGVVAVETLGPNYARLVGTHPRGSYLDTFQAAAFEGELLGIANGWGGLRFLRMRQGMRASLTGVPLPVLAEKGQTIPLSPVVNGVIPVEYTVVSGPARIVGGELLLDDAGPVEIGVTVARSDRFLPAQIRHIVRVASIQLEATLGGEDDELILDWRVGTDVLEMAAELDGPWSPVPGARPPLRIPDPSARGYYRVIRSP